LRRQADAARASDANVGGTHYLRIAPAKGVGYRCNVPFDRAAIQVQPGREDASLRRRDRCGDERITE
jgi:hypothetical protein